jgi:hypothetical protein
MRTNSKPPRQELILYHYFSGAELKFYSHYETGNKLSTARHLRPCDVHLFLFNLDTNPELEALRY